MLKTGIFSSFIKQNVCNNQTSIMLSMAKNEKESCVISLLSDEALTGLHFECNSYKGFTVQFEKEVFLDCNGRKFPDPLVPVTEFDLEKDVQTNILVRFSADVTAEAGIHDFNLTLKNSKGENIYTYTVEVKVWNFALPEKYRVSTSMAITADEGIFKIHDVKTDEEKHALYKKYYDFLLDFRVSPFNLPYDILDEKADQYLSDPRVTSFILDHELDEETLTKQYNKLMSNPDWAKKAVLYPLDEPTTKEHLDTLVSACKKFKKLYPEIKLTSAFYRDIPYDENLDEVQLILDNCDLILPKLTCFNDEFVYEVPEHKEKYGSFISRMDSAKKLGKEVWQYVCWEPGKPYVNMYVDEEGLDHRILFWQQHLVGATGFLYWSTTYWRLIDNPWETMATVPDLSSDVFGDGSLLYNGDQVGIFGPCASVRLECIRDGIEDCEMFLMADELLGRDWVLEQIKEVTKDLKNYTDSPELFTKIRNRIGDKLEKAVK